jgi:hypothetical protein
MVQERQGTQLLNGVGSQGTAALGIMMNLLLALRSKGALCDIEVVAILDTAAETAEKSTGELDGEIRKISRRSYSPDDRSVYKTRYAAAAFKWTVVRHRAVHE